MPGQADHPLPRDGEILVSAQVVIAGAGGEHVGNPGRRLHTGHPGIDRKPRLLLSPLVIISSFQAEPLGLPRHERTCKMLMERTLEVLRGLKAQVHEERRQADLRNIDMVPGCPEALVGLEAAGKAGAALVHVRDVLVVGADEMHLVRPAFESHFHGVVRDAGHGPVVQAENSLVIVGEALAAHFGEESLGPEPDPGFVHGQGIPFDASPGAGMLGNQPRRQPVVLEGGPDPGAGQYEPGVPGFALIRYGEAAVADLAAHEVICHHGELLLLRTG